MYHYRKINIIGTEEIRFYKINTNLFVLTMSYNFSEDPFFFFCKYYYNT